MMTDVKNEVVAVSADNQRNEKPEVKKRKIFQNPRQEKKERIRQAIDWLSQAFPLCFNVKEPKPLKYKIENDILALRAYFSSLSHEHPMPSRALLNKTLDWYTSRSTYYAAFENATHYIDLEGKDVTEIREATKTYVKERLAVMREYDDINRQLKEQKTQLIEKIASLKRRPRADV